MNAPPRTRYQLTFIVLTVGVSAYALLQSMVAPVLQLLQESFDTTQGTVTWVLTAYLLSASVFTPILGRVGDMVGKEKVLVGVLVSLAVGSFLAALATSIGVMIVARSIQGIGGGIIPLSFGIIRDEFPQEKVAGAVGVLAALLAVGGGLGVVLAGPIVNALNYHWLFWIPGGVVAAAAAATYFVVPKSPLRTPGKINWLAAVLLSGWLIALLIGVSKAPVWGWGSATVIVLLALAVVLGVAWVLVELHSAVPLIDMRMMRIHAVWTANLVALLFGIGLFSVFAFIPEYVQTPSSAGYGFGATITESGLLVLPMSVTMFVFGSLSGPLSTRFGAKTVVFVGSLVCTVPFLIMAFASTYLWEVALAMAVLGAGFGLAFSAMSNIVVVSVPASQTGVASGMNANIRTIGGAIGAALMASIITSQLEPSGLPTATAYQAGFLMLATATVLAALAALLIPRQSGPLDVQQAEQAAMAHAEAALVAAAPIVGALPE